MERQSAVKFEGDSRVHIGLLVNDLARSTEFYQLLLDSPPVKQRPGYAKFEPGEPSVNLSLNQVPSGVNDTRCPGHFGIQLKSTRAVEEAGRRFENAGFEVREEKETTCCYSVQDKVWVTDPDGNEWEYFVVVEADAAARTAADKACCA